jgi:2-isopropylmalate synthase
MGFDLGENALEDAFRRFKDLADKKKEVFDEDILALVDDEVVRTNDRIRVERLKIACGTEGPQTAELTLRVDGDSRSTTATGDGPVDATFRAIRDLFPHEAKLLLYQVHAVTGGTDAQAEVSVRLEEQGRTVQGQGADTDTLVASARAYVNALNKLLVKREKSVSAMSA